MKTLKILSVIIIIISVSACQKNENFAGREFDKSLPDQIADSIYVVNYNGKNVVRKIWATHLEIFNKKKLTIADTFKVENYDELGNLQSVITAKYAEIDEIKDVTEAEGNVVVTSDKGILKTEFLTINNKEDEIWAPYKVTLIRNNNVMKGVELKTNTTLSYIEMKKVSAEGEIEKEDFK